MAAAKSAQSSTVQVRSVQPNDPLELAAIVREAAGSREAIYPIGGGTSRSYGLPATRSGLEVDLTQLNRVIDYPSADMTITVEAGVRMARLQALLAEQGQRLPLDVPQIEQATLGGVLATNFSGPLRFGLGTPRDYVIGIRAIDGRGEAFAGGGRVVKNVAGYDFCKLLIGSMGTLGIITEVTLKLKPLPFGRSILISTPRDLEECEKMLSLLVTTHSQPVALEWLKGPEWVEFATQANWPKENAPSGWLVLALEGSEVERDWMTTDLQQTWHQHFGSSATLAPLPANQIEATMAAMQEFPANPGAAAVLKLQTLPSAIQRMVQMIERDEPTASIQSHAGSGTLLVRIPEVPASGMARRILQKWQPAALASGGNLVFLSATGVSDLTGRVQWGDTGGPLHLMQRVKDQFDPFGILNPQRFVFA